MNDASVDSDGMFHYCRLRLGDSVVVDVRAKGMSDASVVVEMAKQPTIVPVELRPRRR